MEAGHGRRSVGDTMSRSLTRPAMALRAAHAGISVGFLGAIGYVWSCGITRRRGPLLRVGDPVPLFEPVRSPRAAKLAVPTLGGVTALGTTLVALRPPAAPRAT